MRRIMINASLCDGCKNCTVACMQAHRDTPGTVYDLDLTDIHNESRNHIEKMPDGSYRPIFCRHCDLPEPSPKIRKRELSLTTKKNAALALCVS